MRSENYGRLFNTKPEKDIMNYTIRTGIGFSGSPVLVEDKDGGCKVVAIHTHKGMKKSHNSGLMLNEKILKELRNRIQKATNKFDVSG